MKKHIILCVAMVAMAMPNTKAYNFDIAFGSALLGASICIIALAGSTITKKVVQHKNRNNNIPYKAIRKKILKGNVIEGLQELYKVDRTSFYSLLTQIGSTLGIGICVTLGLTAVAIECKIEYKKRIENERKLTIQKGQNTPEYVRNGKEVVKKKQGKTT